MKTIVQQQQLAHGVGVVARAVTSRSTLPVLSNILIKTDEGRLRLSATNLELGITAWIGAKISEEGSLTVPARTFVDLISNLPSDEVALSVDERTQSLNVRCGTLNTDTATTTLVMLLPRMATTPSASRMPGKANSTSDTRITMRSHQPS